MMVNFCGFVHNKMLWLCFALVLLIMAIIIFLYAITLRKKVFWLTVNIINIILQMLYMSFYDFRTKIVVAFITLSLYIYLRLRENDFNNGKLYLKHSIQCMIRLFL